MSFFGSKLSMTNIPSSFKLWPWRLSVWPPKSPEALVEACEESYGRKCGILRSFFQSCDRKRIDSLFGSAIPTVWSLGGGVEKLFPGLSLPRLMPGMSSSAELTRSEICSLVVNMLVGATKPDEGTGFYSNFEPWCCSEEDKEIAEDDPRLAYINSLMHYFQLFDSLSSEVKTQKITFRRNALNPIPDWSSEFQDKIIDPKKIKLHVSSGRIGDRPGSEVEMDFANKNVGFGATATQEEIIFGCSPEMCVANLFIPALEDAESVVIGNAFKVCDSQGYGMNLRTKPRDQANYTVGSRVVVCVDALDFSHIVLIPPGQKIPNIPGVKATFMREDQMMEHQLSDAKVSRELNKLLAGFSACPHGVGIACGKWGSGVFMGHPVLKCLLQVVAGCAADRSLVFYLFGDDELERKVSVALSTLAGSSVPESYRKLRSDELAELLTWTHS